MLDVFPRNSPRTGDENVISVSPHPLDEAPEIMSRARPKVRTPARSRPTRKVEVWGIAVRARTFPVTRRANIHDSILVIN